LLFRAFPTSDPTFHAFISSAGIGPRVRWCRTPKTLSLRTPPNATAGAYNPFRHLRDSHLSIHDGRHTHHRGRVPAWKPKSNASGALAKIRKFQSIWWRLIGDGAPASIAARRCRSLARGNRVNGSRSAIPGESTRDRLCKSCRCGDYLAHVETPAPVRVFHC
jgi:hypothetical protein